MRTRGHRVLVTGGGPGIGLAIARRLSFVDRLSPSLADALVARAPRGY
jgi:NAD(P)-dependent dehydrogenase (short-subunit alcohol dehydrogenase family)